jgi:hypothetical protein
MNTERLPHISVCAWCWPMQSDYFRAHPEHAGRILTHGICQKHKAQVIAHAMANALPKASLQHSKN